MAQVGAVAAGRVSLAPSDRVGPGAGTADRLADPHLLEHRDELRAVGGLRGGQIERERAELAVGGEKMDIAGLPATRAPEQGGLQPDPVSAPDASALSSRASSNRPLHVGQLVLSIVHPLPGRRIPGLQLLEQ